MYIFLQGGRQRKFHRIHESKIHNAPAFVECFIYLK